MICVETNAKTEHLRLQAWEDAVVGKLGRKFQYTELCDVPSRKQSPQKKRVKLEHAEEPASNAVVPAPTPAIAQRERLFCATDELKLIMAACMNGIIKVGSKVKQFSL